MNCPSSGTIKSSSQSHQLDVSCFNKTSKLTNLKMSPLMFRVALRCFDFSFQWTKNEQLLTLRHHKSTLSQAFWSHVIYMTACVLTQPEEDESFFFSVSSKQRVLISVQDYISAEYKHAYSQEHALSHTNRKVLLKRAQFLSKINLPSPPFWFQQ